MYEWTATMDTGAVVRFKPEVVTPLGFQDLKVILDPPEAEPDIEPLTHALELYASEGTIIENGETGTGEIRMKARVA